MVFATVPEGDLVWTRGADKVKSVPSSSYGHREFCAECGSHLFSRDPDGAPHMSIRMSAFDSDPGVRPSWRTFVAYTAPWEPIPDDGLERYPEGKPRD